MCRWLNLLVLALIAGSAFGQQTPAAPTVPCQKDLQYGPWLQGVIQEAEAAGITAQTISEAMPFIKAPNPAIVKLDENQSTLQNTFLKFAGTATDQQLHLNTGKKKLQQYSADFARIQSQYGIPASVLLSFWALESNFSTIEGNYNSLTSVATLAYDCRRPELFRPELISALQIVQRGDLAPAQMIGSWAGELSGLQLTPTDYLTYAVDFDGTGRLNLIASDTDMLASGANYLAHLGWQAGQPWLEEVKVPNTTNWSWQDADLTITHTRAEWAAMGVTARTGTLTKDTLPASLLLPMGRLGPAFLVYANFQKVYLGWNSSLIYSTTAAYLATRFDGAPLVSPGNGTPEVLSTPQVEQLQKLLREQGYTNDQPDGKIGSDTRAAVKQAQVKCGLPADSYPTSDLLDCLQQDAEY